MTKSLVTTAVIVLSLLFVVALTWTVTYPSEGDPKNIKYVLWKNGLYALNLDTATDTMIGDASREQLVVGKTKAQLQEKFGYLANPAEASPYLKACYQDSSWKNRDALFIRKSSGMVIFDGDQATDLVLIKGC
jgi:hypothetical protein